MCSQHGKPWHTPYILATVTAAPRRLKLPVLCTISELNGKGKLKGRHQKAIYRLILRQNRYTRKLSSDFGLFRDADWSIRHCNAFWRNIRQYTAFWRLPQIKPRNEQTRKRRGGQLKRVSTEIFSSLPLKHVHCTSSGCGKRGVHINWSMGLAE